MSPRSCSLLIVGLLALGQLIARGQSVQAPLVGRVVAVTDGDTLTLLDGANRQHKIRLEGIDAPESASSRRAVENSDISFRKVRLARNSARI